MGNYGLVRFGEFKPDLRYHGNDGLLEAINVMPVYGSYITTPAITRVANVGGVASRPGGLHVHRPSNNSYAAMEQAPNARLHQVTSAGVVTDVSRVALYTNPTAPASGWRGCSFGPHVIMTNYLDPVQIQLNGAGLFVDMITSTFAPQARHCFSFGQNIFLADCFLPGAYDGLAAGANPTLICWSRDGDARQFGSFNSNPEITGSGYAPLNFDIGAIRGVFAGDDYTLIGCSDGFVRLEGPPYTFRVVSRGTGCAYAQGGCFVRGDFYFWSAAGLARLRGGDGSAEILGAGKFSRWLTDNATGFSGYSSTGLSGAQGTTTHFSVCLEYCPLTDIIFISYNLSTESLPGAGIACYNVGEDRLTFTDLYPAGEGGNFASIRFMCQGSQGVQNLWGPGRDMFFLENDAITSTTQWHLSRMVAGNGGAPARLTTGYIRPQTGYTTRITRVRPIYTATDTTALEQVRLTIKSANKPYNTASPIVSGPYSTPDSHGWLTCPDTTFADWHLFSFEMQVNAQMHKVVEYEAFEYEYITGPVFAA